MYLRRQRSHTKPEAFLQVELPFLFVIFVLLPIILITVGTPTIEYPHQQAGTFIYLDDTSLFSCCVVRNFIFEF